MRIMQVSGIKTKKFLASTYPARRQIIIEKYASYVSL
jgi:hypothetical protein